MRYLVETTDGDIIATSNELEVAVEEAKKRLTEDPELHELTVALYEPLRTICWGPDENWDSVVTVLKPGEKLQPPGDSRWRDEDIAAYEQAHAAHQLQSSVERLTSGRGLNYDQSYETQVFIPRSDPARTLYRCSPEDIDESGGLAPYDWDDPKSSAWHERTAAIWDNREGK